VSAFSRFFTVLWMIFSTTLGILIMQLMSEVDKDSEYVNALVMVLIYLVIVIGSGGYGFFPKIWMWTYTGVYFGMIKQYMDIWISEKEKTRPESVNILGLKVDNVDTDESIDIIDELAKKKGSGLVITPYSEFFVKIRKNKEYKKSLEAADLSLADGIYVNWASLYQRLPVSTNIFIRLFQSVWQYVFTGASIVLFPRLVRTVVKARVSGSDIIYPVCRLAAKRKYKVMLYGGFDFGNGNTGVIAAKKLKSVYKGLNIVNVYPGDKKKENDDEAQELINKYQPDILFMCLGTREPEWLYKRKNKLKFGVAFALGGTFDYVAGDAVKVKKEISESGLEWLARPVMLIGTGGIKTAWKRFKRVWTGMLVGSFLVLAWKVKFGYIEEDK
ncbi:MAG: WecB/TagA/CpsF family glycosyltransferase, partial [bacterium]